MTRANPDDPRAAGPWRALLPLLVAAVAIVAGVGLVHELSSRVPELAAVYNRWLLWLVTQVHAWDDWLAFLLPPALALLIAWPTFPGLRRRFLLNHAVTAVVLAVATAAAMYYFYPWRFARFSPLAAAITAAALLYLWLRATWAYLPLHRLYRWGLTRYLRRAVRGQTYFGLLADLRWRAGRTFYGTAATRFDDPNEKDWPPTKPLGWLAGRLRRWAWLARLSRRLVPPTGRTIDEHDPLLFAEVQRVRDQALYAAECALYGTTAVPPLDAAVAAARPHFRRWLAATDALAECHLFNLPQALDPTARRHVRSAADLFADAARRCTAPTLRGRHEGRRPVAVDWLRQSETDTEAYTVAADFVRREIRCLEWLLDAPALPLDQPAWAQVAEAPAAGKSALDRLLAVRLRLAHLHLAGLMQLARDARWGRVPNIWATVANEVRGTIGPALATGTTDADRRFALGCREKLFDACLNQPVPQVDYARDEILTMRSSRWQQCPPPLAADWQPRDYWTEGVCHFVRAKQVTGTVQNTTYLNGKNAFREAHHVSLRTLAEALPNEEWARQAVTPVVADARPPQRPVEPVGVMAAAQDHAQRQPFWGRRPNYFARLPLYAAALAALVLLGVVLSVTKAGPAVTTPDLRVGGAALDADVLTIAPGREAEPAVWVGTGGDGVHVKAGGTNHHWYHVTTADGLLSDEVVRISVGAKHVAYVCQRGGRRGLCLSESPHTAPGARPWLDLGQWRTLLGFSGFGTVDDTDVTVVLQPAGGDLFLVGTWDPLESTCRHASLSIL